MSSINEDILVKVKVDDQTGEGINSVKGKFNAFRAAAGVAITAVGSQMLNFSQTCINSAVQAEAGWNSYTTALERVGGTAGRNIGEIKSEVSSLASELGRATGDVRQAATDFMNYGTSAETAMKGASAVSAIAAAKNMDYASSEQIVMSALKGRGAQLKTLGIDIDNYKDATTGAIDTTRLFADIQTKFGSSQEKYSKSAAANQQRLTNSMNAFKTAVGTALVPILQAVTPLIVQFANALSGNSALASAVGYVTLFGGALSLLSGPLMTLQAIVGSNIFSSLASQFMKLASPIKNVITNTQALYAAWKERPDMFDDSIFAKLSRLKENLIGLKGKAVEAAQSLASMAKSGVSNGLSALKTTLTTVKTRAIETGTAALDAGKKLASMAKSSAATGLATLKTTLTTVKTAAIDAGKALLTLSTNALKAGASAASSAAQWLVQKAALLASKVATAAQTIATWAMTTAQTALNLVMSLNPITLVVMAIIALVAILVIAYMKVDWFRNGINQLGQYLLQLAQTVYTVFASIPATISSFIGAAVSAAVSVGFGIYNGIMNFVNNIISGITSVFNQIASTISNFASTVYNSAVSIGSNIVNGIIDGLGSLGSWFASLFGIGAGDDTFVGAGGPDAGAPYTGNQSVSSIRTASAGNPYVSKTTTNSNRTIILNAGALTFDTRNLTTHEAKQVVIGALESLG